MKQRTQKQIAFRRLGLAVLLFLLFSALTPGHFLLSQSRRELENANLIAPTQIIQQKKEGPFYFCLSANEDVLFLTNHSVQFPYGWLPHFGYPEDLKKPVSFRIVHGSNHQETWSHTMVFGAVTLEDAVSVRLRDAWGWTPDRDVHAVDAVWTGEILTSPEGLRYFWFGQDLDPAYSAFEFRTLDVLDKDGRVLYTCDPSETYSSFSIFS